MLLDLRRPADALTALKADLVLAPGRRNALADAAMAARDAGDRKAEDQYRRQLQAQSAAP
jgi:hypothetical protein